MRSGCPGATSCATDEDNARRASNSRAGDASAAVPWAAANIDDDARGRASSRVAGSCKSKRSLVWSSTKLYKIQSKLCRCASYWWWCR